MFFSIIIPIYNVEKYLDKCVNSLLNQDFEDYEIFLVNDSSTDSSGKIASSYANNKNIFFIDKKKNTGLSDSRNIGLKLARGEYIIFIDSDDYVESGCLKKIKKIILDNLYPDIVYTGFIEDRNGKSTTIYGYVSNKDTYYKNLDFLKSELSKRTLYAAACFGVYRRKLIIENELYFKLGIFHEDELWTPKILYNSKSVFTTELAYYHYVRREDSITRVKDKTKNGLDLLETCKELTEFSNNIKDFELRKLMNNHIAMLYMKAMTRGKLYRKPYCRFIEKSFPLKNTIFIYDRLKAILFWINLYLYYIVDSIFGDNER